MSLIATLVARPRLPASGLPNFGITPPLIELDGTVHDLRALTTPLSGRAGYVLGATARDLARLCRGLRVERLHLYDVQTADLTPLSGVAGLRALAVTRNTRLTSLDFLAALPALELLSLSDTRITDLAPLARLQAGLRALQIAGNLGGLTPKAKIDSLAPLAFLTALTELSLLNLAVQHGGLRPLVALTGLQTLHLPNSFATEDYACLSVHLPGTACDRFAASIPTRIADAAGVLSADVSVTGHRKPLLLAARDGAKIARYAADFAALRAGFAAQSAGRAL